MGNRIIIGNNNIQGRNITIINGVVVVDGKQIDLPENEKVINIYAESIDRIEVDSCNEVIVKGNSGSILVSQGNVSVGGNVDGDINVSQGNVYCGNIGGDVSVSIGNIRGRKW
jgi:hypothetical protein